MRDSLRKSLADSPAPSFARYPKGSIVICNACALPIFRLDFSIALGDRMGKSAAAFKPIHASDIDELIGRSDIDAGLRTVLSLWTPEQRTEHLHKLREVRAGDPALCPVCGRGFMQVLAVEKHEVLDKSYTVEMLTIPPFGVSRPVPIRGKHLGAGEGKDWIHR